MHNAHNCAMRMSSGPHAQGTTMASSMRSEVLVRCGISVVKKQNTTSVVRDYFWLRANPDGSVVRGEADYFMCISCGKSVPAKAWFRYCSGHNFSSTFLVLKLCILWVFHSVLTVPYTRTLCFTHRGVVNILPPFTTLRDDRARYQAELILTHLQYDTWHLAFCTCVSVGPLNRQLTSGILP